MSVEAVATTAPPAAGAADAAVWVPPYGPQAANSANPPIATGTASNVPRGLLQRTGRSVRGRADQLRACMLVSFSWAFMVPPPAAAAGPVAVLVASRAPGT